MKFSDYKQRAVAHEHEGADLSRATNLVYQLGGDVEVAIYLSLGAVAGDYSDPWSLHLRRRDGYNNISLGNLAPAQFRMLARIREALDAWTRGERAELPESGTTWSGE